MAKGLKIDYYDHMCYCTMYECVDGSQGFIQGVGTWDSPPPPPPKNLEKNLYETLGALRLFLAQQVTQTVLCSTTCMEAGCNGGLLCGPYDTLKELTCVICTI